MGIDAKELAARIGWSPAKMSRIELGKSGCSEIDAAIYLGFLRIPREDISRIIALCTGDEDGSWLRHHGQRLPDELRTLVLHETIASSIFALELNRIDGLLQTEDYTRAMMRESGLIPDSGIEPRVQARKERQTLLRRISPPDITFYIHEHALRLPVGGNQVMHEQMLELVFRSQRPCCTIRVIPAAAGAHAGLGGPFRMMRFEEHHPVICLETQNRSLFLESVTDIATYQLILGGLADVALNAEESRSMLVALASEYDRPGADNDADNVAQEQLQR